LKKEKDKKILFIGRYNEDNIFSGPEKTAKRIYEYASHKHKVKFIQYFFDGRKYSYLNKLFGKYAENNILTLGIFPLLIYLFSYRPDIIHIITFERFAAVAFIYKIFSRVKIIYNVHGLITLGNKIKNVSSFYAFKDKICEKLFLKYSDKIIFPSGYYISIAGEYFKFNKDKAVVIPNGIDEIFYGNKDKRASAGGKLKIIIETYKIGVSNLIDSVFANLNSVKDNIELHLINSNDISYKSEILDIFNYNKMPVSDFADFLKDKDVFISLAEIDTFSISTAESMAAGVIPLVLKSTGIASYINNNINGFIYNYDDIANILRKLWDIELRNKISIESSKIYSVLNWDEVYNNYESVYNELA
jgi:glycosyltransferase involved in cell wall biosynthesis